MSNDKKEKQKNKAAESDVKSLDHSSDIISKPQKVERQEQKSDSTTIPEVFD
jgi:hypothetical protein